MDEQTTQTDLGADPEKITHAQRVIFVAVIIVAIISAYYMLKEGSAPSEEIITIDELQILEEEAVTDNKSQTLVGQISKNVATDNPASEVPQTNIFETETNPFKNSGFKNPFE